MDTDLVRRGAVSAAIIAGILSGVTGDYGKPTTDPTLLLPAGYAFAIWAPIYAGGLAYATYQAQPSRRRDPLLRRTGWPTGAAFLLAGLWVRVDQHPWLQLGMISATVAAAALAYGRSAPRPGRPSDKRAGLPPGPRPPTAPRPG